MSTFDEAVEAAAGRIKCRSCGAEPGFACRALRDTTIHAMRTGDARAALTAAGLPELLAENERLRDALKVMEGAWSVCSDDRDEARAALARVHRVREKWATDGMPVDFDSVLFDLDDALGDEARAALADAEMFKEQYHEQWMLTEAALVAEGERAWLEGVSDADAAWKSAMGMSMTGRESITNPYRIARTAKEGE